MAWASCPCTSLARRRAGHGDRAVPRRPTVHGQDAHATEPRRVTPGAAPGWRICLSFRLRSPTAEAPGCPLCGPAVSLRLFRALRAVAGRSLEVGGASPSAGTIFIPPWQSQKCTPLVKESSGGGSREIADSKSHPKGADTGGDGSNPCRCDAGRRNVFVKLKLGKLKSRNPRVAQTEVHHALNVGVAVQVRARAPISSPFAAVRSGLLRSSMVEQVTHPHLVAGSNPAKSKNTRFVFSAIPSPEQ